MKTLYLDCGMGAAGDMLGAALLMLLPDPDAAVRELNALGIPGVRYTAEQTQKKGITGLSLNVTWEGQEETVAQECRARERDTEAQPNAPDERGQDVQPHTHADGSSDRPHSHGHHHHGMGPDAISGILDALPLSERVKRDAKGIYRLVAEAESEVHGQPVTQIHFHELGTMDAIADVTAICFLMEKLQPDEVVASPVRVGYGQLKCAHGILPVPAPATALILRGVPTYAGGYEGEFCTPTGAAALKYFVNRFGEQPEMAVEAVGYGCGRKDFPAANCLRAMIGSREDAGRPDASRMARGTADEPAGHLDGMARGNASELVCNIDDMTAEEIAFACERLLKAGALDVWTESACMKKGRPGVLIFCLCRREEEERMAARMLAETTTLGVRVRTCRRYMLKRHSRTEQIPDGSVRIKSAGEGSCARQKIEYEDAARIAENENISLREARERILRKLSPSQTEQA